MDVLLVHFQIEPFEPDYLITKIKKAEKSAKYNLLYQLIALAWEYKNFNLNYTAEKYLQEMAEFVLADYMLTTSQKVNSFVTRYVLRIFGKAIYSQQQISLVEQLVRLKMKSNGSIPERYYQSEYDEISKEYNEFLLTEEEIAMDLLIQSFAPPSLSPKGYIKGNNLSNYKSHQYTVMRKRAAGAYVLVNSLLDPSYRLEFNNNFALSAAPEIILKHLEKQAWLNFEKHLKKRTWPH